MRVKEYKERKTKIIMTNLEHIFGLVASPVSGYLINSQTLYPIRATYTGFVRPRT